MLARDYERLSKNAGIRAGGNIVRHFFGKEIARIRNPRGLDKAAWIAKHKDKEYVSRLVAYKLAKGKTVEEALDSAHGIYSTGGSMNSQRATATVELIHKYRPEHILDPCSGFGSRMIGAVSQGIKYTGYDTNARLAPCYEAMLAMFPGDVAFRCADSATADLEGLDYDCVWTSPPYWPDGKGCPLESYDGMPEYTGADDFHKRFMVPMIANAYGSLCPGGIFALCIPQSVFDKIRHLFPDDPVESYALRTSPPSRAKNPETVYIWRKA